MPKPTLPVPDDFARYASIEGNLKLRKRFNVGGATIERWRVIIGARYNREPMPKKVSFAARKRVKRRWQAQEQIEDLEDFDVEDICASIGIRMTGREW